MARKDVSSSIVDAIKDTLADATGKERTGFESSVCEGCPHRGDGTLKPCRAPSPGKPNGCGCPTITHGPLDQAGMVPEGCIRKEEHARQSR